MGQRIKNWLALGDEIAAAHEPLLAKDAYEKYIEKVNHMRGPGKELA